MKRIDNGLQYTVYDLGGRRVLKVPRSLPQQIFTLLSWGYRNPIRIARKMLSMNRMMKTSLNKIKRLLADSPLALAGNPVFIEGNAYEQDRATPLKAFLIGDDVEKAKAIIDDYIQHVFTCWSLGFSEMTTNLTINNGLTEKGEVILLDIGELLLEKDDVAERIASKRWRTSSAYRQQLKNQEIKNYFDEQMEQYMTHANLHTYWESKLSSN